MRLLQFTESTEDDLAALFEYVALEGSDTIARVFVAEIVAHCRRLAGLPGTLGTARQDLARGLRSTPHQGYVIYFRYAENLLEVVKVLDARRNAITQFRDAASEP